MQLTEFRAAVVQHVADKLAALMPEPVDVYGRIPDDVNLLPCIVAGYPTASPAFEDSVFDRDLIVYVVGRRVDVGDPEGELVALADLVADMLGGTRGTRTGAGPVTVSSIDQRVVQVAGLDHDCYLLTVSSPYITC